MRYQLETASDWPDKMHVWLEKHKPVYMVVRFGPNSVEEVFGCDTDEEAQTTAFELSKKGGHVEIFEREGNAA